MMGTAPSKLVVFIMRYPQHICKQKGVCPILRVTSKLGYPLSHCFIRKNVDVGDPRFRFESEMWKLLRDLNEMQRQFCNPKIIETEGNVFTIFKETESTRTKLFSILKTLQVLRNDRIYTKSYVRNKNSRRYFTKYYNQ